MVCHVAIFLSIPPHPLIPSDHPPIHPSRSSRGRLMYSCRDAVLRKVSIKAWGCGGEIRRAVHPLSALLRMQRTGDWSGFTQFDLLQTIISVLMCAVSTHPSSTSIQSHGPNFIFLPLMPLTTRYYIASNENGRLQAAEERPETVKEWTEDYKFWVAKAIVGVRLSHPPPIPHA
jgi:hypothetical protein